MKPQIGMSVVTVFTVMVLTASLAQADSKEVMMTTMLLRSDDSRGSAAIAITEERKKSSLFGRRLSRTNEVNDSRRVEFDSPSTSPGGRAVPIPAGLDYHRYNSSVATSSPFPLITW